MSENIIAEVNHQKYDHVFRIIFNDRKEALSLYNALANTNYTDPDLLEINTLEDAVFIGMKNDVSFIINDYLNLYEHQSTTNPNMPLRGLFYLSDLLKQMYYDKVIYTNTKVEIMTPKYIVFYNGVNEVENNFELRLSESYINKTDSPDLEVVAHVININYGHNEELSNRCQKLKEYSIFVDRVHKLMNGASKDKQKEKLLGVIDSCIRDHILEDILSKERSRIMASILSQFDADKYVEVVKQESYERGSKDTIINLVKEGLLDISIAADKAGMTEGEFKELLHKG